MSQGFCRDCGVLRTFRTISSELAVAGRPPVLSRACGSCGLVVLTLADLHDSTGFAETVVRRARRRASHAFGDQTAAFDPEDAVAHLLEQLWRLYRSWKPAQLPFTSYASQWLPRRLDDWVGNATGSATRGGRRRRKARPAVEPLGLVVREETTDLAPLDHRELDRLARALGRIPPDTGDDWVGDLGWILAIRDRRGSRRPATRRVETPLRRAS